MYECMYLPPWPLLPLLVFRGLVKGFLVFGCLGQGLVHDVPDQLEPQVHIDTCLTYIHTYIHTIHTYS